MKVKLSQLAAEFEQYRDTHTHAELVARYVGSTKLLGECPVRVTPEAMTAVLELLKRNTLRAELIFKHTATHSPQLQRWYEDLVREFSLNTARFDFTEPVNNTPVRPQAIDKLVMPKSEQPASSFDSFEYVPRPMAIDKLIIKTTEPEPELVPSDSKKTVKT